MQLYPLETMENKQYKQALSNIKKQNKIKKFHKRLILRSDRKSVTKTTRIKVIRNLLNAINRKEKKKKSIIQDLASLK